MEYKALKSFPYYPNGVTRQNVVAGDTVEVSPVMAPGLERAGYITKAIAAAPENKVVTLPPPPIAPVSLKSVAKGPRGKWYVMEENNRVSIGFDTEEEARANA
jgi:hypothetical protein